jgi:hypothetical protein
LSLLCAVFPLTGDVAVLKVCDLEQLCRNESARFEVFRRTCFSNAGTLLASWLSAAVSFYTAIVRTAYRPLLLGRRSSSDRTRDTLSRLALYSELSERSQRKLVDRWFAQCGSVDSSKEQDEEEFCVLSTWEMVTRGRSLAALRHPLLPILVCLDEDDGGMRLG